MPPSPSRPASRNFLRPRASPTSPTVARTAERLVRASAVAAAAAAAPMPAAGGAGATGGSSYAGGGGGGRSGGGGGGGRPARERFQATCSGCGKVAEVPFQPRGNKP